MRNLILGLLVLASNVGHASTVDKALSTAIAKGQVGRVRMLLQNRPNLHRLNPGNDWSYLWQALFSTAAYDRNASFAFTDAQKEMAEILLRAEPNLVRMATGRPAQSPLALLFRGYVADCETVGCEQADRFKDRIRFLVEHGARIESETYEKPNVRMPLHFHLAGERPEVFELALSLGVPINDEFDIKTEFSAGRMRLLSYLTSMAIAESDSIRSEWAFQKLEMLLRRGADPRKNHRMMSGSELPIFVTVFLGWDSVLQRQSLNGEPVDSSRFQRVLGLFFEYGLSEHEEWGDSYIREWTSQTSAWRRSTLRLLMRIVNDVSAQTVASTKCEVKLE